MPLSHVCINCQMSIGYLPTTQLHTHKHNHIHPRFSIQENITVGDSAPLMQITDLIIVQPQQQHQNINMTSAIINNRVYVKGMSAIERRE